MPHGLVETPAYVIVGTHAKVRTLEPEDLRRSQTQMIIVNTYHMWKNLGEDGLADFSGLHSVMNWQKPLMTDSGGFQVFSLGFAREHKVGKIAPREEFREEASPGNNLVDINADGVFFRENNELKELTPEKSIWIQEKLGADIMLAFDEPTSPLHGYGYTKESLQRTHRWAERSLKAKTSDQLLYGIIQGGAYEDLRKESALFTSSLDFDGLAIGGTFGTSFGDTREDTFRELSWTSPLLPAEKPRHLLGIGRPEDIYEAVSWGVDTFDCVIPTREGRHGSIWTEKGRIDIKRSLYQKDNSILDPECACPVCAEFKTSRAYLNHLFKSRDPEAGRLASLHNVYFFNTIMKKIREDLAKGTFSAWRKKTIFK